jgi:hypothetical protein
MSGVSYIRKLTDDAEPWYVRAIDALPWLLLGAGLGMAIIIAALSMVAA